MIIDVQQSDIETSKKLYGPYYNPYKSVDKICPIALAAKRTFPSAYSISVRPSKDIQCIGNVWLIDINSEHGSLLYWLSEDIGLRASHFDRTRDMEPFSFEIKL